MKAKPRVMVALSGGVDSSVAALLLLEQGFDVVGLTMKTWDYEAAGMSGKETGCCSLDSINDARSVAVKYGFPHYVLDLRKEFEEKIISNFIDEYLKGKTPNPCVLCNKLVKWDDLLAKAQQLNCDYIATGHYSSVVFENNRFFLRKSIDDLKDQTYVLWGLSQHHLSKTIFPLSGYVKSEVKKLAVKFNIPRLAAKSESYEICFIPDNNYRKFLKQRVTGLENLVNNGDFIDKDGKVLGKHKGFPFYTIGQRKGLEIAVGHPLYVNAINAGDNTVTLGERNELLKRSMMVSNLNLMKYDDFTILDQVTTKIRYHDKGTLSRLVKNNDKLLVEFYDDVSAVTPGQSAVFYQDNDLIGGGIIVG